jgi:sugar phosphate permease
LLPGYFDTVTVFIVFAGCAMFSAVVLLPHWNSRPAVVESSEEQSPVPDLKALRT